MLKSLPSSVLNEIVTFNIRLIEECIWFSMTCLKKNILERTTESRICLGLKFNHQLCIGLSIRFRIRAQLFSYSFKTSIFFLAYKQSVQKSFFSEYRIVLSSAKLRPEKVKNTKLIFN